MVLTGMTARITGGTTGIGFATARCLAAKGSRVVIGGRDAMRGERAVNALRSDGADAVFVRTDVAHDDQVAALAATAAGDGTIDIWFNNAGIEGFVARSRSSVTTPSENSWPSTSRACDWLRDGCRSTRSRFLGSVPSSSTRRW